MRKIILVSAGVSAFFTVFVGSMALYIYTKDFGVGYTGRARLDYNWKYYFTACPEGGHRYDGKFFSFSYPKLKDINPLRETTDLNQGSVSDGYLLYFNWEEKPEKTIKSELLTYLSSPDGQGSLSEMFMRWLVGSGARVLVNAEKIKLKSGGAVVVISGQNRGYKYLPGLESNFGRRYVYIIGLNNDGILFKAKVNAPLNMPEAMYRERVFGTPISCSIYPDAETDAQSACVLNVFLRTFVIKNL